MGGRFAGMELQPAPGSSSAALLLHMSSSASSSASHVLFCFTCALLLHMSSIADAYVSPCEPLVKVNVTLVLKRCRAPESIGQVMGLAAKSCSETEPVPVDEKERELLRNQVPGWRVDGAAGEEGIRRDWTAQVLACTMPQ